MPDLVISVADSIVTMCLRILRTGANVGVVNGVAPESIFNGLAKWCALAQWSAAEGDEEDLEDDDDEDTEELDDDDFDDDDFVDDDDDDDLDDDEDDDKLLDVDEVTIDDDRS